jgi:FkbM family methyltransferase
MSAVRICYYTQNWPGAEIGRQARLRCACFMRGGSSPPRVTSKLSILFPIKHLKMSGNRIEITEVTTDERTAQVYFKYKGQNKTGPVNFTLVDKRTNLVIYRCIFEFEPNPNVTYWVHSRCGSIDHSVVQGSDSYSYKVSSILGACYVNFDGDFTESHEIDFGGFSRPFVVFGKELHPVTNRDVSYGTFLEVNVHEIYNRGPVKVLPGDLVLDIGANYGYFSLYALGRGARSVISMEPFHQTYECLVQNVCAYKKIQTLQEAICSTDEMVKFQFSEESVLNHLYKEPEETENTVLVKGTNINTLFDRFNLQEVDFLKVDCEGAELDLFKTISEENIQKVKKTVIEYHSDEILSYLIPRLTESGLKIYDRCGSSSSGLIYAYR